MSENIYDSGLDLDLSESADIYSPHEDKVRGTIDGNQYEILVNDRPLPVGIPPDPPVITEVIPWDKKVYVAWELQSNPLFDVFLRDGSTDVLVLEGYDGKSKVLEGTSLQNGVQYDLQVQTEIVNIIVKSSIKTTTLFSVAINDLSQTNYSNGNLTLDWTEIAQVTSYDILEKDSSGVLQRTVNVTSSPATISGIGGGVTKLTVKSISAGRRFEGSESNEVVYIPAPENLTGSLDDTGGTYTINLDWDAVNGVDGYDIYVKGSDDSSFSKVNGSLVASSEYSYNLSNPTNTTLTYYVRAVVGASESEPSNQTSIDIPVLTYISEQSNNETITTKKFDTGDVETVWDESNVETITTS